MSETFLFSEQSVEDIIDSLTAEPQSGSVPLLVPASLEPQSVPAGIRVQLSPSAPHRLRWFEDEAPKLEEWLVYPTYLEVAAELDTRHLPGIYIHSSRIVVKGRDTTGKLRSLKVSDISFVEAPSVRRLLSTIYSRVRHDQIVATGGRHLTEEQFKVLPEATYKALTVSGTSSPTGKRQSVGTAAGRRVSQRMAVIELNDES